MSNPVLKDTTKVVRRPVKDTSGNIIEYVEDTVRDRIEALNAMSSAIVDGKNVSVITERDFRFVSDREASVSTGSDKARFFWIDKIVHAINMRYQPEQTIAILGAGPMQLGLRLGNMFAVRDCYEREASIIHWLEGRHPESRMAGNDNYMDQMQKWNFIEGDAFENLVGKKYDVIINDTGTERDLSAHLKRDGVCYQWNKFPEGVDL